MREKNISLSNVYYILEENGKLNLILLTTTCAIKILFFLKFDKQIISS